MYGATYSLLSTVFGRLGVKVVFVEIEDLASVKATISRERPKIVWIETISNPLLRIADVPALAAAAHAAGAVLMVDSTFTTPYLFRSLEHGADYVIHSATTTLFSKPTVRFAFVFRLFNAHGGCKEGWRYEGNVPLPLYP